MNLPQFLYLRRSVIHTRSRRLYEAYREMARALVHERIKYFSRYYGAQHGIKIGSIAIRNQKSRWGSCSKRGNLNFNYKLIFLSPEVRDYVIVHEICHIKEFNHGRGFWNLVAEAVPNYRELRKQLKSAIPENRAMGDVPVSSQIKHLAEIGMKTRTS